MTAKTIPTPMRWVMFICAILAAGFWLDGKDAGSTQKRGDVITQKLDAIDTQKIADRIAQQIVPAERPVTREIYTLLVCDKFGGTYACNFPDNGARFFTTAEECAQWARPYHDSKGNVMQEFKCFKRDVQVWEPVR